jgi:hypothetical protein
MTSACYALQTGLYEALTSHPGVLAALGAARVYDDVPQPVIFPFVTIGAPTVRDWSTGTEPGLEHLVTINIWSRYGGKRELYEIADAVREALDDRPIPVAGQHLVNLRHQFSDLRRDADGETHHAVMRFRAVTEPAA